MRSLRGRLTLGLTLVLAGAIVLAGVLAAREADRSERDALDDRLRRTAELSRATALAAVQEELPSPDDRLDAVLSATRTSLRLVLGRSVLLRTGREPPSRPRLPQGLSTFEADGTRYRAYATSLRDEALGGLARLELTTDMTPVERRQDELRDQFLVLGAVALVLSALGVFVTSGFLLRPLDRLREATASIADDEDLDRRVPADRGPSEVRAVATSFNAMLGRLSRSAAERTRALEATRRFAADAGHELRTPMTSLRAQLSSLARHPDLPAERRTRMLGEALAEQRRLVALLDGLQALARGDVAPPATDVDLAEVTEAALDAVRERHPGTTWDAVLPDGPVTVRGWEPGLRSIADNLLENAARHGRDGGTVRLRLSSEALVVEDDGPGVPEDARERIFEPFTRLGADGGAGGSGLGLALVAQQARHHGATLDVGRSADLGGARFEVRWGQAPA